MYNRAWIDEVNINECAIIEYANKFLQKPNKTWRILEAVLLLKTVTIIDLTTLTGDDTISNVTKLVNKALCPLEANLVHEVQRSIIELIRMIHSIKVTNYALSSKPSVQINDHLLTYEDLIELKSLLKVLGFKSEDVSTDLCKFLLLKRDAEFENESTKHVRVAAICVYPKLVKTVENLQKKKGLYSKFVDAKDENVVEKNYALPIASVAAGFPSGQYDIDSKIKEVTFAIQSGASEIDIVISRNLVIGEYWQELFEEIRVLKETCGNVTMKTILAVGECGSFENIYKASMVAMMAGSDYIKTSTGKELVNATIPVGIVMCRAVRNFYIKTGKKIGFKPAGGIKTADDALQWLKLILTELGAEWLSYFRIGASSMLVNIEQRLKILNVKPSIIVK